MKKEGYRKDHMKTEKGVYIVPYKETAGNPRFIILKRKKNWEGWETPKGHLEGDDYGKTVEIELSEETGIGPEQIERQKEMDETVSWQYEEKGQVYQKEYRAFLVEVSEEAEIDVSENPHDEHEMGLFLRFRDASSLITHDDNLELLEKANNMIE